MEVSLEVGGIANPGTRIAKIIKTDLLELEVPVEIDDLKWVSVGDKVKVMDEFKTSSWQGEIIRISEFLDPATQSASVFVQIRNQKSNPIYAGMFLEAHFENKIVEDAMEIPRQAVFNQNEVFIVQDNALQKRKINVRKINQNSVIFTGLEEGMEVVVEPLVNVKEGTVVKTDRL
jgi:RND family efflux transporter MFP subunit